MKTTPRTPPDMSPPLAVRSDEPTAAAPAPAYGSDSYPPSCAVLDGVPLANHSVSSVDSSVCVPIRVRVMFDPVSPAVSQAKPCGESEATTSRRCRIQCFSASWSATGRSENIHLTCENTPTAAANWCLPDSTVTRKRNASTGPISSPFVSAFVGPRALRRWLSTQAWSAQVAARRHRRGWLATTIVACGEMTMIDADGTMSIEEAARACGVSDETIRRRLRAKRLPGAFRQGTYQVWRIPITALVAAGFTISTAPPRPPEGEHAQDLSHRLALIERLLAERDARIQVLERNLDDLRAVLRVMEAGR
jgi:hypothetical protein